MKMTNFSSFGMVTMWNYVKNGNMTSRITMSSLWLWPIKPSPKDFGCSWLSCSGWAEFSSLEDGLAYYPLIRDRQIVVKPKSTNFGLGISIFQEPASLESYPQGFRDCFSEDAAVLVEEFIAGTEYRFFVLDGQCEAVLLRWRLMSLETVNIPWEGGGHQKRQSPAGARSSLAARNRELGDIELLMLDQQAMDQMISCLMESGWLAAQFQHFYWRRLDWRHGQHAPIL